MNGIVWLVLTSLAVVWLLCCLALAALTVAAHRGDPRVITPGPWGPEDDFALWEIEQHVVGADAGARVAWS